MKKKAGRPPDPYTKMILRVPLSLNREILAEYERLGRKAKEELVGPSNIPKWRQINNFLCYYIQKGIDHERDLASSGFRDRFPARLNVGRNRPKVAAKAKDIAGIAEGHGLVQEEAGPAEPVALGPPVCHGRPMIDYGTHWFCLMGNHKERKS